MSSVFSSFGNMAAQFQARGSGEDVQVTPKGAAATTTVKGTVFRDRLQTRPTDGDNRLEYGIAVQIAMEDYPADKPTIGGDAIAVKVRTGDTDPTTKTVSSIISQVGGMWFLALD